MFTVYNLACIMFGVGIACIGFSISDINDGNFGSSYKKLWICLVLMILSFVAFNVAIIMSRQPDDSAPHRPRIKIPGDIKKGLGQKIGDTLPK